MISGLISEAGMKYIIISHHVGLSKLDSIDVIWKTIKDVKLVDYIEYEELIVFIQDPQEMLSELIKSEESSFSAVESIDKFLAQLIQITQDNSHNIFNINFFSYSTVESDLSKILNFSEIRVLTESLKKETKSEYTSIAGLLIKSNQGLNEKIIHCRNISNNTDHSYYVNEIYRFADKLKYQLQRAEKLMVDKKQVLTENSILLNELHLSELAVENANKLAKKSFIEKKKKENALNDIKRQKEKVNNELSLIKNKVVLLDKFAIATNQRLYRNDKIYKKLVLKSVSEIKTQVKFDEKKYLEFYPDVAAAKIDPILHYILNGWIEGRRISESTNMINFYQDSVSKLEKYGLPLIPI